MNPLILIALGVAAYAVLQKKEPEKKKEPEPEPKDEPTAYEPSTSDYTDSAGTTWTIYNPKLGDWYVTGRKVQASSRRELLEKLENFVAKRRFADLAERRAGELAGHADAEDSAKAYKESWTGIGVDAVSKRFDKDQSDPWLRGYRQGFGERLDELGFTTNEDGKVKKKD